MKLEHFQMEVPLEVFLLEAFPIEIFRTLIRKKLFRSFRVSDSTGRAALQMERFV